MSAVHCNTNAGARNVSTNSGNWTAVIIVAMPVRERRFRTRRLGDIKKHMKRRNDYHQIIAETLQDIAASNRAERVKHLQSAALAELEMTLNRYTGLGYGPALLLAIAIKKSQWILEAATKKEIQAILNPQAPIYDGNKFYPDKYMPPEEEAICWCETSLRAPLNEAGYNRYMEVFQQVFHKSLE